MKNFILSLSAMIIFSVVVFALPVNECKTDIYFGNGVWNTPPQAQASADIVSYPALKGGVAHTLSGSRQICACFLWRERDRRYE